MNNKNCESDQERKKEKRNVKAGEKEDRKGNCLITCPSLVAVLGAARPVRSLKASHRLLEVAATAMGITKLHPDLDAETRARQRNKRRKKKAVVEAL
jgi:hypothetical protein